MYIVCACTYNKHIGSFRAVGFKKHAYRHIIYIVAPEKDFTDMFRSVFEILRRLTLHVFVENHPHG